MMIKNNRPHKNVQTALLLHAYQPYFIPDNEVRYIVDQSYFPVMRFHREKNIPLTLNIQGCLLERLKSISPDYLRNLQVLVQEGLVELTTSAYYHPLLPLISRKSRMKQIRKNIECMVEVFRIGPTGFWPPELAWNPADLTDLSSLGIKWVVIDGSAIVQAYSTGEAPNESFVVSGELRRPYCFETAGDGVERVIVFVRHHLLSNELFDGDSLLSQTAAKRFIEKFIENSNGLICLAGDSERVAGIALDHYRKILHSLKAEGTCFTTYSDVIESHQNLEPVFVLSETWRGGLKKWVRGEKERSYLEELKDAWKCLLILEQKFGANSEIKEAEEALLKAESSCHLYWRNPIGFIKNGYFQIQIANKIMDGLSRKMQDYGNGSHKQ